MLRRLLLRFKLPFRRSDAFFFNVFPRDSDPSPMTPPIPATEPEKELERWRLPPGLPASMIELPRWLASHSSVNLPLGRVATGAMRLALLLFAEMLSGGATCEFASVLERVSASATPPW